MTTPDALHDTRSVAHRLRHWAATRPRATACVFLCDGAEQEHRIDFGELDRWADRIAAAIRSRGGSGGRVLLAHEPGLEFVAALLGCWYAGAVAVPCYPPAGPVALRHLEAVARDCRPRLVLASRLVSERRPGSLPPALATPEWLCSDGLPDGAGYREPEPGALAMLQYTSGTTQAPRGVMLSHENLVQNEILVEHAMEHGPETVFAGWLPLYHDMGLIGQVLQPLFLGIPCVLLSPSDFLQKPVRWLRAISRYGATTSGAPNFAYELCVRKIAPDEREGLDLGRWKVAFVGAEPIRHHTLAAFARCFAPYGFRSESFYPCYGLAESTLMVSGGRPGRAWDVLPVDGAELERGRLVPPAPEDSERSLLLVGCGEAQPGHAIEIVDPESRRRVPEGSVGELWVAGPSVARGYWDRPRESKETFAARIEGDTSRCFLRTGDLGAQVGGRLFLTGRRKDLIIQHGRNLYPQELEATAEQCHPGLRRGRNAMFAIDAAEEKLVLVQEIDRLPSEETAGVVAAIRRALASQHRVGLHAVVLIAAGTIPKTSSGKVQRHACRAAFLAGTLELSGSGADPADAAATLETPGAVAERERAAP